MPTPTERPFDPLDYDNIANSVVRVLLERPLLPLAGLEPFRGAGIYALYYTGALAEYGPIATPVGEIPIYVGKAVPTGARKGTGVRGVSPGRTLCNRLRQHSASIEQAENLKGADFLCRYLVVEPVWIRLAERVLIQESRPVWNTILEGFGNHPPGRGRRSMRRPRWDIVHPGRAWAMELEAAEEPATIWTEVRAHLERSGGGG